MRTLTTAEKKINSFKYKKLSESDQKKLSGLKSQKDKNNTLINDLTKDNVNADKINKTLDEFHFGGGDFGGAGSGGKFK